MTEGGGLPFFDVMHASGCVLAFDTAEDFGTVVVARVAPGGGIEWLSQQVIAQPRQQASLLTPTIAAALAEAQVGFADLAGIVVGAGPGSFTGVRVAASTAKGLLFGSRTPLWTPSSLLGAALDPAWGEAVRRGVAFDARGDRVYAAIYEVQPGAPVQEVLAPSATTIRDFVGAPSLTTGVLAGSAIRRHTDVVGEFKRTTLGAPIGDPSAAGLIRALTLDPDLRASENPSQFEPSYLRGSSATPLADVQEGRNP